MAEFFLTELTGKKTSTDSSATKPSSATSPTKPSDVSDNSQDPTHKFGALVDQVGVGSRSSREDHGGVVAQCYFEEMVL